MGPIDYLGQMHQSNIAEHLMRGLQTGQMIRQGRLREQQYADQKLAQERAILAEKAAKEEAILKRQQFIADMKTAGEMADASKYNDIYLKYPEFTKEIDGLASRMELSNEGAALDAFTQARSAATKGNYELAAKTMEGAAQTLGGGNESTQEILMDMATGLRGKNPQQTMMGMDMMGMMKFGDKFMEPFKAMKGMAKTGAETEEIQAKTAKTRQETEGIQAKTKALPDDVKKQRNTVLQGLKKQSADYGKVKSLIEKLPVDDWGGNPAKYMRKLTAFVTGGSKESEGWRQQLESYKLVDMLKNKPPGALSEGELFVLQQGVPPEGASAEVLDNYLRASKRALIRSYAYDKMQIKYLEKNRDMGTAQSEIKIGDHTVQPGETFDDFIERIGDQILNYGPGGKGDAPAMGTAQDVPGEFTSFLGRDKPAATGGKYSQEVLDEFNSFLGGQ